LATTAPRNRANKRLYLLAGILVLWAGAICLRLVYLQIFRYGDFEQRAQRQQQRTTEVTAKRGIIYDRAGRELAMSVSVDSVFAVPADIPDLAGTISLVARITKSDPRELLAKCQAARTFCWVARKADAETADRIRDMNLRGIYFQKESKRFYPKRELAAQVLGYVGMDDEGLSGIERADDEDLRGKPGRMLISVDARRKWFGSVEKQPDPGENVVLTIDEKIQYIAERELETAMQQTHAETGTVVVQNPKTGEILALANRPTFNPNLARDITPQRLKDHAVSDAYEPGSTFKVVTIAAALEEKLTRPEEMFDCQMGSIVINGMRIRDSKPHGVISVADVLAVSSDVGAIKIALRLGEERFYKYIRAFGFGQQTGIELPGETRGLTKPLNRWSKVSIGAISMGQEIGITPLQLVSMISTIANDGVWTAPRIIAGTTAPQGTPQMVTFHPGAQRRVISPMTAALMKRMMQGVILAQHATGKAARLEGYSAAGKTGTGQKIDPATRTYSRTKYVASFAGFAPVNDPAVTVAVILDSPVGQHQGGQVSAPVFQRVAQQVLEYLHTPHDVELPTNRQVLMAERRVKDQDVEEGSPDRLGDSLEAADAMPPDSNPPPAVTSAKPTPQVVSGLVMPAALRQAEAATSSAPEQKQSVMLEDKPPAPLPPHLPSSGTIVLDVEQGGIVVPSFLGKSVRTAIEMAQESGLDLDAVGSGLARQQSPAAGSHVASGSQVTVKFGR
jgi:cell division protein FtsI (penicillin-binding protein 3)